MFFDPVNSLIFFYMSQVFNQPQKRGERREAVGVKVVEALADAFLSSLFLVISASSTLNFSL